MKQGTTLLELMVYVACTVLIASLAGQLALSYVQEARQRALRIDTWVQLALALDRLHADLRLAPQDPSLWKKRSTTMLIFPLGQYDCGWCIEHGRLVRVTGIYDTTAHHWAQRATSTVLDAADCIFRCTHDGTHIVGIKATLAKKCANCIVSLDCFTALKKGNLHE